VTPGVARLAIVVVLVVGGIAVLANGFADNAPAANPRVSASESPSASPSPSKSPEQAAVVPNKEGVLVQVLNGTNAPGLAGDFQILLEDEGYLKAGEPADAPDKPVVDSVIYFRRDGNAAQNKADAGLLAETYLDGAAVEPLPASYTDVVSESADVVVVMGEDRAGAP
jgi:LytR cell envelope-related transcriptional attenuator